MPRCHRVAAVAQVAEARLPIVAVALAGLGALALSIAPILGLGPLAPAVVVAALVALAVPIGAATGLRRGAADLACGLLAGAGPIALALVAFDIDFLRKPIDANRFELLRPTTAADTAASAAGAVALAGHLLIVGAAGVAFFALRARADDAGPLVTRAARWWSAAIAVAAVLTAAAVFAAPWSTADPVLVVRAAVETSAFAATAGLAAALLLVVAVTLTSSGSAAPIVGAALTVCMLTGTRAMAGVADAELATTRAGAVAALAPIGLAALALAVPTRRAGTVRSVRTDPHRLAGAAALVTAALAAAGALTPALSVPHGVAVPDFTSARAVLIAAIVLAGAAVWLLFSEFAAPVRPALGPVLCALVASMWAVGQDVADALQAPGVSAGLGAVLLGIALFAAAGTGLCIWFAGSAERDDVDTSADAEFRWAVAGPALIAAVVASAALASGVSGPLDGWGRAVLGIGLLASAVVAGWARPERAVGLLAGSLMAVLIFAVSRLVVAGFGAPVWMAAAAVAGYLVGYVNSRRTRPPA